MLAVPVSTCPKRTNSRSRVMDQQRSTCAGSWGRSPGGNENGDCGKFGPQSRSVGLLKRAYPGGMSPDFSLSAYARTEVRAYLRSKGSKRERAAGSFGL